MSKARKTLKGRINKLIDSQIHPYFKEYPTTILVDGLLHAIIEQKPK
jgi:hypothetical protein